MDSLDRKFALKSLFESEGYKMFKEALDDLNIDINIKLDNASARPARSEKLNFLNGIKKGVGSVNDVLLGIREELEESADGR